MVAGVLPPHRFATGSGVLNMCRQISLALGVALLVAILGTAPSVAAFHRGFALMIGAGVVAALCSAWLPARVPAAAPDGRPVRGDRNTPPVEVTAR